MSPQESIAHYRIVSKLGEGGMGAVYRATDTKLNRDVAIKVLPEAFANNPDRLARFAREALMLASLNHPNIAAIYGVEDRALVMELVEGERLLGPLPVETALGYAKQIAEALEAAHEKGIMHRDLKPANIMITTAGFVKLLDFGLAKATDSLPASGDPAISPTMTMSPTTAGTILGTVAYMAPEQARGKPVDRRADIWAFGVVMHEMLTGKQTFSGESVTEVLASVMKEQPALDSLPARVRRIVERCLQKDPRQRWQAIGDVRLEIEQLLASPDNVDEAEARLAPREPLWKRAVPIAVVAILASAITTAVATRAFKSSPRVSTVRFSVALGVDQVLTNTGRVVVAISPDGTQMAYLANRQIYLRPMAELAGRTITNQAPRTITNPVFSPDGKSIAYFDGLDGALRRIAVTGGVPVTICPTGNPAGMSWDNNGIVLGDSSRRGIVRVSPNGGNPELLVSEKNDEHLGYPQILPGGRELMFTAGKGVNWDTARIVAQNLKSGARTTLIAAGSAARYVPTGHIVYALGGVLHAAPFDLDRLEVTGASVPIVEGVLRDRATGVAQFVFSDSGSLLYVPGSLDSRQRLLAIVDDNGAVQRLKLPPAGYMFPRVTHDGKRLAYMLDDGQEPQIWVYDLSEANAPRRLTFQGSNRYPVWSADDQRVAFQSDSEGDLGIFWKHADGTGTAERLTARGPGRYVPDSFSPDGQYLSYTAGNNSISTIWILSLRDRKATLFADSPSGVAEASTFSPDSRWIAYTVASANVHYKVYVQTFPATSGKYEIGEGTSVLWSRDGKKLIFGTGPTTLGAVNVTTEGGFAFSSPVSVPRGNLVGLPNGPASRDILPDGRLVGVVPAGEAPGAATEIQVVLNWFEELKRGVPAK